jgi:glutamate N-acetyltransferase/amino-acid N-acetyltransferase
MPYVYHDLGITITPGPGPNSSDDLVSFTPPGWDKPVTIANSLVHQPAGIHTCAGSLGLKKNGKPDFTVITLPQPGNAAAVFSQSRCPSYAVLRNRACLAAGMLRAVAVNSGIANVFTPNGMDDLRRIEQLLEQAFGIPASQILISQTGMIGIPLPMANFEAGIPTLPRTLREDHLEAASEAILTSDIAPKVASVAVGDLVLCGIAKGAGMVEPNMATMLAYFFTNARLETAVLQHALVDAVNASFNRISIDGDTSTSDTVALLSTRALPLRHGQEAEFRQTLTALSVKLARDLVSQGEGVTKTMDVTVESEVSLDHAQRLAKKICNSSLVKTAMHGAKSGWGRIIAAIGKPEAAYDDPVLMPDRIEITVQSHQVYQRGQPVCLDRQALTLALRHDKTVRIRVVIGAGGYLGRAWGCDLSPAYIQINM